jgi:hypothetical protein
MAADDGHAPPSEGEGDPAMAADDGHAPPPEGEGDPAMAEGGDEGWGDSAEAGGDSGIPQFDMPPPEEGAPDSGDPLTAAPPPDDAPPPEGEADMAAMDEAMDDSMDHDHGDMDHGMEPPQEYAGDGEGMPDGCPEDTGGETDAG